MFLDQTYERIKQRVLDNFPMQLDKREGSFSNFIVSPICEFIAKVYMSMGDIMNLGFIADTYNAYLDKRIGEFGVYRKLGTKATGSVKVIGKDDTVISNGSVLACNGLKFIVLNDIVLPTDSILFVEAESVGVEYNLPLNSEFELLESNEDVVSLISDVEFKGGLNVETDEELRKRFVKVVNNPSTSGNKAHYEEWALEVDGVSRAVIYPLWNGNGTVKVMCIGLNNTPIDETIIEKVTSHIQVNKPIGASITITTPTILDIVIVANVKLTEGYTTQDVGSSLRDSLSIYINNSINEVVYSKIYGLLANNVGVNDISELTLNGLKQNITIPSDKIASIGDIDISEVV